VTCGVPGQLSLQQTRLGRGELVIRERASIV